jgi:hypothetical protein
MMAAPSSQPPSGMLQPATTFPKFSQLPAELRLMIWHYAISSYLIIDESDSVAGYGRVRFDCHLRGEFDRDLGRMQYTFTCDAGWPIGIALSCSEAHVEFERLYGPLNPIFYIHVQDTNGAHFWFRYNWTIVLVLEDIPIRYLQEAVTHLPETVRRATEIVIIRLPHSDADRTNWPTNCWLDDHLGFMPGACWLIQAIWTGSSSEFEEQTRFSLALNMGNESPMSEYAET